MSQPSPSRIAVDGGSTILGSGEVAPIRAIAAIMAAAGGAPHTPAPAA